ncbi:GNAT family N-acetyltransferase [Eggerthellaceae bacterium zg-1084]|uniref:GNAT family N-acetyltransferase n=1 Tax=Berryella wangjianweii TaxID=2734634 RepID=A0A6M8J2A2_9ACTN|nr:GNAT family N-acetyltransferase [Berryella wangjianweii]NPD31278.1 GNAT family N-acetyltransferase [Berryella wangjianweii]QKF06823.1 GNAT family N-acetyltransferase [Berryella wangjianweii]
MDIRRVGLDELDEVMDLYDDGRRALAALGIDQWQNGRPSREMIESDIRNEELFSYDEDGARLGCIMLTMRGDENYDLLEDGAWETPGTASSPDYLTIHRVVTDSRQARRGVASRMLAAAEEYGRVHGARSVRVDTHPGNVRMQGLLAKLGYRHCGRFFLQNSPEATTERWAYEKLL